MEKVEREGDIKRIKIDDIIIGERIRQDFKDMEHFALVLQIEGMHQPILVDIAPGGKYNLIEGERRIRAMKMNGETKIDAIIFHSMSETKRLEVELMHCVQRQQLHFTEEALATKKIVERKKLEGRGSGLIKYGRSITNKEVAIELAMTEARMSENLRIASALEDHPELEASPLSRKNFLRSIRAGTLVLKDEGALQQRYKESFIVTTPLGCLDTLVDPVVDLAILQPDRVDPELFTETCSKLRVSGQVITFCEYKDYAEWEKLYKNNGLNVAPRPYIWNLKGTSDYQNFIWGAKNILQPIRPMQNMMTAGLPPGTIHPKAKPLSLMTDIVKNCTERGAFVLIPECCDIESVRCCIETERNVRAATSNKILRDRLILGITQN